VKQRSARRLPKCAQCRRARLTLPRTLPLLFLYAAEQITTPFLHEQKIRELNEERKQAQLRKPPTAGSIAELQNTRTLNALNAAMGISNEDRRPNAVLPDRPLFPTVTPPSAAPAHSASSPPLLTGDRSQSMGSVPSHRTPSSAAAAEYMDTVGMPNRKGRDGGGSAVATGPFVSSVPVADPRALLPTLAIDSGAAIARSGQPTGAPAVAAAPATVAVPAPQTASSSAAPMMIDAPAQSGDLPMPPGTAPAPFMPLGEPSNATAAAAPVPSYAALPMPPPVQSSAFGLGLGSSAAAAGPVEREVKRPNDQTAASSPAVVRSPLGASAAASSAASGIGLACGAAAGGEGGNGASASTRRGARRKRQTSLTASGNAADRCSCGKHNKSSDECSNGVCARCCEDNQNYCGWQVHLRRQLLKRRPNTIATISHAEEHKVPLYCVYLSRADSTGAAAGVRILRDVRWRTDKPLSFDAVEVPAVVDANTVRIRPQRKQFKVQHVVRISAVEFTLRPDKQPAAAPAEDDDRVLPDDADGPSVHLN
jgi:hypothetical protein